MKEINKLSVEEKLHTALEILESIPGSGYWPYASPAPCSTEVNIKNNLNASILYLERAIAWHEEMFGKTKRDCMSAPETIIESIN